MQKKILALDYGLKRIGVAISDEDKILALQREIIENSDLKEVLFKIKSICQTENIEKIIIGLPLNMNGSESNQSRITKEFSKKLEKATNLPIVFEDERFTSKQIKDLREFNKKSLKQNHKIDSQSAALLLQGYLDKKNKNSC